MDDKVPPLPPPQLSQVDSLLLFGQGVLKAWLALVVGVAIGYGVALVLARLRDSPVRELSWELLANRGPISVIVLYGMGGILIEVLRVQGQPRAESGLGAAAVGIGLYAGLWW